MNTKDLVFRMLAHKFNISYMPVVVTDGMVDLMKDFYSREEAWLLVLMPLMPASAKTIARLQFKNPKKVEKMLQDMVNRGLLIEFVDDGVQKFQMAPFIPGVVEMTLMKGEDTPESRQYAKKMHDLLEESNHRVLDKIEGMGSSFARVIPVNQGLSHENQTLPYEDVRTIINGAKRFAITHCHCRTQKFLADEKVCDAPRDVCMSLDFAADFLIRAGIGKEVDHKTMLQKLDLAEEHNLVHMSDNSRSGFTFVCNCCGCCCGILTATTKMGRKTPVIKSSYIAEWDSKICTDCGKCSRVCQVNALTQENKVTLFSEERCLGCGECIETCPEKALRLVPREDWEEPEATYGHMVADMMARRIKSGTLLQGKKLPGQEYMAKMINKRYS
jgi:ferredoxin